MATILLVDDSPEIKEVVTAVLQREHEIEWAQNLRQAQDYLDSGRKVDLVLLDIDLPDGSGMDFLGQVAGRFESQGVGTIFLTGTNNVHSRVRSFSLGALDYIPKPFDIVEFQVRVNAKLRTSERSAVKSVLNKGNITVDLVRQQAFEVSSENRRQLDLTPVEFRMLLLFLQKDGSVVTRKEILDTVWGQTAHVSARCVDHHVCGLRKKINPTGQKIESIYGVGYRIDTSFA
ncbi:MAG: response regulator transcription factor [Bdellovibrionaceae bacterium]|nr:response regulator transcription factor [Pseudobdellovibrionaceae bacterium]